jgi:hypothetical protein
MLARVITLAVFKGTSGGAGSERRALGDGTWFNE